MTAPDPDQVKTVLSAFAKQIRDKEAELRRRVTEAADAEGVYRQALARKYGEHRAGGDTVAESELRARADVVVLSRDRDVAQGLMRAVLEELENRRGERSAYQSWLKYADGWDGDAS